LCILLQETIAQSPQLLLKSAVKAATPLASQISPWLVNDSSPPEPPAPAPIIRKTVITTEL